MENIRLGVIGYGNMGTTHCKNAANGLTPNMVLTAICDISEARRNVAKENHGDVAIFDNYTDLLKSGLCDLVIVATPHYDHPKMVADAFAEGLHVICEKPMVVTIEQLDELYKLADSKNLILLEAMKSMHSDGLDVIKKSLPYFKKLIEEMENKKV